MILQEFDENHKAQLCQFFASVFFYESIYYSKLDLSQKDLEIIYSSMLDLVFRYKENKVIGFMNDEGRIVSAGVAASPKWVPNLFSILSKQMTMFLRLGPRKAYKVAIYLYGLPPVNVPQTWHLILLATDSGHRSRGFATQILYSVAGLAESTRGLYLEALKNSPAQEFYIRHGFQVHNDNYTDKFCIMFLPAEQIFQKAA